MIKHNLSIICLTLLFAQGCFFVSGAKKSSSPLKNEQALSVHPLAKISKLEINERFLLPEKTEKNVIYLMIALDDKESLTYKLKQNDQVDVAKLINQRGLRGKSLNQEQLFDLLLAVELKIRLMMKEQPDFMRAVLYVGQAKDFLNRAKTHQNDMAKEVKQLQSSKVRWVSQVLQNHYVRLSYMVKNIPVAHLSVFECLVGHLFSVLDFKGSAQLGATKSWETLMVYFESPQRLSTLKKFNLLDSMEKDREKLRELILPFKNPWQLSLFEQLLFTRLIVT